jgi:hypothetical protein
MKREKIELGALGVGVDAWACCGLVTAIVSAPMPLDWGVTGIATGAAVVSARMTLDWAVTGIATGAATGG